MNTANHPTLNSAITTAWLLRHNIAPRRWLESGVLEVLSVNPAASTLALDVLGAVQKCPVSVIESSKAAVYAHLMERAAHNRESVADLLQRVGSGAVGGSDISAGSQDTAGTVTETVTDLSEPELAAVAGELLGRDPDLPGVIRLVNAVVAEAVRAAASDIHLEPDATGLKVRYRIDGLLEDYEHIPAAFRDPVVSRIKVMSKLDVSVRQQPQDGAFDVTFGGRPLDVRVSTVPTPSGQRVVMRLLDRSGRAVTLEKLGMPVPLISRIESILKQTQGLFLVAGPTGSGKTTTLYACLNRLDVVVRNTITIEDPVEYHVPGVSQVQVGRDRNMGFADGLRSILRQDPDVIMVGEIRDRDTAATALQASLTGHLILSTIHTTDPASAVIRLLDLGIEPPLIAETLSGVMDQRLVRTLCPHCSRSAEAVGCPACRHTGYLGRTGLFRYLGVGSDVRRAIRASNHQAIRDRVDTECGSDLNFQAAELIAAGRTSEMEIQRVIQTHTGA